MKSFVWEVETVFTTWNWRAISWWLYWRRRLTLMFEPLRLYRGVTDWTWTVESFQGFSKIHFQRASDWTSHEWSETPQTSVRSPLTGSDWNKQSAVNVLFWAPLFDWNCHIKVWSVFKSGVNLTIKHRCVLNVILCYFSGRRWSLWTVNQRKRQKSFCHRNALDCTASPRHPHSVHKVTLRFSIKHQTSETDLLLYKPLPFGLDR